MVSPVKIWRNQKKIREFVGCTGTIIAWTIIRVPPAGFSNQAPYPVVVVELDQKDKRITAQYVDYINEEIKIGQKVKTVVRRAMEPDEAGVIVYGIKVTPV